MAISVVQSVQFIGSSNTTTFTLSGLSTTAGNLYAIAIGIRDTAAVSSVTDSASNSWVQRAYTNTSGIWSGTAIWTSSAASPSAITSITVTMGAATFINFEFHEIKGAINNAIDASSTGSNQTAGAVSSGTATPVDTTDIAIGVISTGNTASYSSTTFTSGTGTLFTLNQSTVVNMVTGYLILSSATGQAFSATSSANYYASDCIVLIKAAPIVGGELALLGVG